MKTVEIKCDGCGADLTDSGPMPAYRLELSPQSVPSSSNFRYGVIASPDIRRAYHFCDLACLDHWRQREKHRAELWRNWHAKYKETHGHKDRDGKVTSWPGTPEEMRLACAAEFEEASLKAFPMETPKRK